MNRFRDQRGQAMVMSVAFLTVLVGMAALVLDVGSWYRADRHAQTTADAAALAGAQGLQTDAATARALAIEYADKNEGGVTAGDVSVSADTVRVTVNRPARRLLRQALRAELGPRQGRRRSPHRNAVGGPLRRPDRRQREAPRPGELREAHRARVLPPHHRRWRRRRRTRPARPTAPARSGSSTSTGRRTTPGRARWAAGSGTASINT